MHRTVAGLAPAAPGYRRLRVAPVPGGGLTHASAQLDTVYGRASVHWRRDGDILQVDVVVPPNTTAEVTLPQPGLPPVTVGSGSHAFTCAVRPASDDPPIPIPLDPFGRPRTD
jgi:alpha-L-rhamnosidase